MATRRVLVDTSYFVALMDARDDLHPLALQVGQRLAADRAELLTTDAVLLELGNYFSRSPLRPFATRWIREVRAARGWEVVPVERPVLLRAEARYAAHADKRWSLTDCHSMEVMHARGLREIATADAGFAQAGYRCLLRR